MARRDPRRLPTRASEPPGEQVLLGCAGHHEQYRPDRTIKVVSLVDANANVGKLVTVYGKAGNAKLAAVIQTAGRLVIYCTGLPAWPAGVEGTYVTAHGTLEQNHSYEATRGPDGEVGQGTEGPIWALANCQYDK